MTYDQKQGLLYLLTKFKTALYGLPSDKPIKYLNQADRIKILFTIERNLTSIEKQLKKL